MHDVRMMTVLTIHIVIAYLFEAYLYCAGSKTACTLAQLTVCTSLCKSVTPC